MKLLKGYTKGIIFITLLFFLFGAVTVFIQFFVPYLRDIFELSYAQVGLVVTAFYLPYVVFSIPAGFAMIRIGYQRGIILGLLLVTFGALLFYPAAESCSYIGYLAAIFVLASGITFLHVALNPFATVRGNEASAPSRLTLLQAFNSLGTTIAPILAALYLFKKETFQPEKIALLSAFERDVYFNSEALTVQIPFMIIALLTVVLAFVFSVIKLPRIRIDKEDTRYKYRQLLKKPSLMLGAIAIFLYVGAEVSIGCYAVNFFIDINITHDILENDTLHRLLEVMGKALINCDLTQGEPKVIAEFFLCFYWGGAMIGRFVGSYLTRSFAPAKVLMVFTMMAIVLILVSINTGGLVSMWSLLSVGLFNSILFPTIFALALEGTKESKAEASNILCTVIVGGGIIPLLFGLFTDAIGFKMAFLALVVCYAYILFYGFYKRAATI